LSPEGQKSRSGRSGQVTSRLCFSITHILADGYSTTPPRPPERYCKYRISSDGSRSCQTERTRDCCGDGQVEQLNAYRALLTPYHEAKPKDSNRKIACVDCRICFADFAEEEEETLEFLFEIGKSEPLSLSFFALNTTNTSHYFSKKEKIP
jgi:hypothetical protein